MTPAPTPPPDPGFTLLELAVVLVVVGLVSGMTVATMKPALESARLAQTQNKLDAIEDALFAYRVANGRVPCPADVSLGEGSPSFGVESAIPGTCTGGSPAANRSYKKAVEGGVPVATIGLPREFAYDAWGEKFVYAVDPRYTGRDAFATYTASASCGGITVKDAAGGNRTTRGMYVLLSHGPNGHGGYTKDGVRVSSSSANADEQENCDCNAAAANTAYDGTYVQRDSYLTSQTNQFDDLVRQRERWQWRAPDEKALTAATPCTDGFRIDGVVANEYAGVAVGVGDINGDDVDDIVIGTDMGNNAYVVFGSSSLGTTSPLLLSSLNGTNGFTITRPNTGFWWALRLGNFLAVDDINRDGYDDVVLTGADTGPPTYPALYVVFGGASPWPAAVDVTTFTGANAPKNGFAVVNDSGWAYAQVAVGDVNGDTYPDVTAASTAGNNPVVFGKAAGSNYSATVTQSAIASPTGFVVTGYGARVASLCDMNRDGIDDLYAMAHPYQHAKDYAVFGKAAAWGASIDTGTYLDGIVGFWFDGLYGAYEMRCLDFAADGNDHLLISNSPLTQYVLNSKASWAEMAGTTRNSTVATTNNTLASFTYSGGYVISGNPGEAVMADMNRDGREDFVSTRHRVNTSTGVSVFIWPKPVAGWPASSTWDDDGDGYRIDGFAPPGSATPTVVDVAAGDVNADGHVDLIVSSSGSGFQATSAGSVYVLFSKPSWSSTQTAEDLIQ